MYRPNRIGPWPLVSLDSAPSELAGLSNAAIGSTVEVTVIGVPNVATTATTVVFTGSPIINTGFQGAFGRTISGASLFEEDQYIVSLGGLFLGFSAAEGIAVLPVIGRVADNGTANTQLTEWAIPPIIAGGHVYSAGSDITPMAVSINTEVIIGDWVPEGTSLENEIFFGFWLFNGGAGQATVDNIIASISLHRYEGDLQAFDPNR